MRTVKDTLLLDGPSGSVEYEVEADFNPGEKDHFDPRVGGPGGWTPGSAPYLEEVRVYWSRPDRKAGLPVRERRPELDDLVDEDALLELAREDEDEANDPDDSDRRRDEHLERAED